MENMALQPSRPTTRQSSRLQAQVQPQPGSQQATEDNQQVDVQLKQAQAVWEKLRWPFKPQDLERRETGIEASGPGPTEVKKIRYQLYREEDAYNNSEGVWNAYVESLNDRRLVFASHGDSPGKTQYERYSRVRSDGWERKQQMTFDEKSAEKLVLEARTYEASIEDVDLMQQGAREFKQYRKYLRPEYPDRRLLGAKLCKDSIYRGDELVIMDVVDELRREQPYMGHRPGEHILTLSYNGTLKHYGTIHFTNQEYLDRFRGDVFPMILGFIVALLAFDPGKPDFPDYVDAVRRESEADVEHPRLVLKRPVLKWLARLYNARLTELMPATVAKLKLCWETKFSCLQSLPNCIQDQVRVSKILYEAAWLLCLFRQRNLSMENGWQEISWFLLRMTDKSLKEMSKEYSYGLGIEALRLLKEGRGLVNDDDEEQVLIIRPASSEVDIHDLFTLRYPSPGPFPRRQLDKLASTACKVLGYPRSREIINGVRQEQDLEILPEDPELLREDEAFSSTPLQDPANTRKGSASLDIETQPAASLEKKPDAHEFISSISKQTGRLLWYFKSTKFRQDRDQVPKEKDQPSAIGQDQPLSKEKEEPSSVIKDQRPSVSQQEPVASSSTPSRAGGRRQYARKRGPLGRYDKGPSPAKKQIQETEQAPQLPPVRKDQPTPSKQNNDPLTSSLSDVPSSLFSDPPASPTVKVAGKRRRLESFEKGPSPAKKQKQETEQAPQLPPVRKDQSTPSKQNIDPLTSSPFSDPPPSSSSLSDVPSSLFSDPSASPTVKVARKPGRPPKSQRRAPPVRHAPRAPRAPRPKSLLETAQAESGRRYNLRGSSIVEAPPIQPATSEPPFLGSPRKTRSGHLLGAPQKPVVTKVKAEKS